MTIDTYTKVILTVIALSTSTIALKGVGIIPTANAQSSGVQKVVICSSSGGHCGDDWIILTHDKKSAEYLARMTRKITRFP